MPYGLDVAKPACTVCDVFLFPWLLLLYILISLPPPIRSKLVKWEMAIQNCYYLLNSPRCRSSASAWSGACRRRMPTTRALEKAESCVSRPKYWICSKWNRKRYRSLDNGVAEWPIGQSHLSLEQPLVRSPDMKSNLFNKWSEQNWSKIKKINIFPNANGFQSHCLSETMIDALSWNIIKEAYVDTGLLPEKGDRASRLHEGSRLVAEVDHLLGLREVGHLTVVVYTTDLKSGWEVF